MNPMVALSAEGGDDLTEGLGEGVLLISAAFARGPFLCKGSWGSS